MAVLTNFAVIFQEIRFPLTYKECSEKLVIIFKASLYMEDKSPLTSLAKAIETSVELTEISSPSYQSSVQVTHPANSFK
jgi:hypothetical protein